MEFVCISARLTAPHQIRQAEEKFGMLLIYCLFTCQNSTERKPIVCIFSVKPTPNHNHPVVTDVSHKVIPSHMVSKSQKSPNIQSQTPCTYNFCNSTSKPTFLPGRKRVTSFDNICPKRENVEPMYPTSAFHLLK